MWYLLSLLALQLVVILALCRNDKYGERRSYCFSRGLYLERS